VALASLFVFKFWILFFSAAASAAAAATRAASASAAATRAASARTCAAAAARAACPACAPGPILASAAHRSRMSVCFEIGVFILFPWYFAELSSLGVSV
jgi:hypothetical protein